MTTASITFDTYLDHAPDRVWRALTDPDKMRRWFMDSDFKPELGHRFALDMGRWGTTRCEVLALEPRTLLKISWQNPPLDTTVTWRLVPEGAGTHLHFEHAGFDLDDPRQRGAYDGMSGGWRGKLTDTLVTILREPAAA
jgi:uncharacterized protein YndB with AHSA1/START domain